MYIKRIFPSGDWAPPKPRVQQHRANPYHPHTGCAPIVVLEACILTVFFIHSYTFVYTFLYIRTCTHHTNMVAHCTAPSWLK